MNRLLALPLSALLLAATLGTAQAECPPAAIHLLRHAEKDVGNPADTNPPLSAAGQARAHQLAQAFQGTRLDALFSTDYRRTRDTLAPLAQAQKLSPKSYDPKAQAAFAARLAHEFCGQQVLVAGHSNTVPELMNALGVSERVDIPENRYGDLFTVRFPQGVPKLERGRYGE